MTTLEAPLGATWRARAACRALPGDLFFPTTTADLAAAVRFCGHCRVRYVCAADAMQDPSVTGVRAGTTKQQRDRARRGQR